MTSLTIAVDSMGNPIDFEITGGQVHDSKVAHDLLDKFPFCEYKIADKGYDSKRSEIKS